MRAKFSPGTWGGLIAICFLFVRFPLSAKAQHYQLLEGSTFLDDCAICDRLSLVYPLRGEFDLVLLTQNTLFSRYAITNVQLVAAFEGQPPIELRGTGELQIGGEVALLQRWVLQLSVTPPNPARMIVLTNDPPTFQRPLPNLAVSCVESNGGPASTIRLEIKAAPLEEIWFLTHKGSAAFNAGDIVSSRGRVVNTQSNLLSSLATSTSGAEPLSIDALDIRASYRISLSREVEGSTFGPVKDGDLISNSGARIASEVWRTAFGISPETPDPGMDAVHFLDAGDTLPLDLLFSIRRSVFSAKLNRQLGRGDLLAYTYGLGAVAVRSSNAQLLELFHPPNRNYDYGLDAIYLWQHGEIWFSVEEGFFDAGLGAISEGDVLSDRGFIVFRNADLVRAFNFTEKADLGLGDFFVVTDAGYPATQFMLSPPSVDLVHGNVTLSWRTLLASGTVVQVERAPHFGAAFKAISPIIPQTSWTDIGVLNSSRSAIYRLRQWP